MVFIIVFIGICAVPTIGLLLGYENANLENRPLAELPEMSSESGVNIDYPSDLEDYLTDHFAFRPIFATADAFWRAQVFGDSPTDQVIVGEEGWLYFEPTMDDYIKYDVLSDNEIYRLARTFQIQQTYMSARDITFIVMVAPNKASIYPEYMPARFIEIENQNNYEKLIEEMSVQDVLFLDLHALLRAHPDQVYHKWDSHWNNLGALNVYHRVVQVVEEHRSDLSFPRYDEQNYILEQNWSGDLSNMVFPGLHLQDEQMRYEMDDAYRTARPMRTLEDLLIETINEEGVGSLLMFRDSFANALIPFFSNAFDTVTYSRAIPYDYRYLTEDTDVVIFEIAERNIENVLQTAPLLYAHTVRIDAAISEGSGSVEMMLLEENDGLRVAGIVVPENYNPQANYNIYLAVGDSLSELHLTFPILEERLEVDSAYGNVAFSLWLDTTDLDAGEYTVTLIVEDDAQQFISIETDEKITVR